VSIIGAVAGPYVTTYGGVPVGIMEGDAGVPTLIQAPSDTPISSSDRYGKATIETIKMGVDYYMQMMAMEYVNGSLLAFAPWTNVLGLQPIIGSFGSDLAQTLILNVIAGTSAVGNPNSLTAPLATIAPGFQANLLFGPQLRTIPIKLILLPFLDEAGLVANFILA
jgi:hypothetical protein